MLGSKRAVILITGGSKGIGKEIAIQVASKVSHESTIIIVARNVDGLNETKQAIQKIKDVNVEIYKADFSSNDTNYINDIANLVSKNGKNAEIVAVFHNAGTLGNQSLRSDELNSSEDWHSHLQTNLVSTIMLNNAIYSTVQKDQTFLIVDITSLLAITSFPSFTQYSVAKASREAFFRSFAIEHPESQVLSYSPGPVNTGMRNEVATKSYDEGIRNAFKETEMSEVSRSVLTTTQTVSRLMEIIHDNKFKSGSRIDYFDN